MDLVEPRIVVADERDADAVRDAGFTGTLLTIPDESIYEAPAGPRRPPWPRGSGP